jgi:hypothetical protein
LWEKLFSKYSAYLSFNSEIRERRTTDNTGDFDVREMQNQKQWNIVDKRWLQFMLVEI